jgi:hypothetical protein
MLWYIIIILLISLIVFKKNTRESFYNYYPPSNCVEDAFGDIKCYPLWDFRYYNQWGY